jgi:superfamily II DNA or RNA helicase
MKKWAKFCKLNKNRIKLRSNSVEILNYVKRKYSVKNPNYKHIPFGQKELSCVSPTFTFQVGMTLDIMSTIQELDASIIIDVSEIKDMIIPFSYKNVDLQYPENDNYKYRDYQEKSIRYGLKYGRGTFELATSAGKSLIIYGLIKNIWHQEQNKCKTLVLVPNMQLVSQMAKDFIEYGCSEENICTFSAKFNRELDPNASIIISNRQWLEKHQKELPNIDLLIVDECQQLASFNNKVSKFVSKLKTHRKFGFTGTIPQFKPERWNIIGLCGKVLMLKKASELQDDGYVAQTKIISLRFNHKCKQPQPPDDIEDQLERAKMLFPLEWQYIENCEASNQFMIRLMNTFKGNTIFLYDHIEHGHRLKEYLESIESNKQIFLIDGTTKLSYRENVRITMENDNNCFLLGNTKCIGTGINIKNIHNIGFGFSAGKTSTKIIQAIGRGLRLNEDKTKVVIVDFYHNFKYSTNHFGERLNLYKDNYNIDKIIYKYVDL